MCVVFVCLSTYTTGRTVPTIFLFASPSYPTMLGFHPPLIPHSYTNLDSDFKISGLSLKAKNTLHSSRSHSSCFAPQSLHTKILLIHAFVEVSPIKEVGLRDFLPAGSISTLAQYAKKYSHLSI